MSDSTNFPNTPETPKEPWQKQYANYPENRQKKTSWWKPVVIVLGVIFLLFVGFIGLVIYGVSNMNLDKADVKEVTSNSILVIDFSQPMKEHNQGGSLHLFDEDHSVDFFDALKAIERAAIDERIKGIYLKPLGELGMAQAMELQEALLKFKESKKFIYSYSMAFDEKSYLNALPADSIFMPKEGMLMLNGFSINPVYMKGFLDKIGVEFTTIQFEDFKSAGEGFSRKSMSDSARLEYTVLLNQRNRIFTEQAAKLRKLDAAKITDAMNTGVYQTDDALARNLIDGTMSESAFKDFLKQRIYGDKANDKDKKVTLIGLNDYPWHDVKTKGETAAENKTIALINTVGEISASMNSSSDNGINAKRVIKHLREARDDKNIAAIVLRIDSPGGSVLGSDEIWQEIMATKKSKPVIASMGNVAASGGYYMAMACDTIVAHPATITGSIGVILAIPNISGAMSKLDITTDNVSTSPASEFLNVTKPFSTQDKTRLTKMAERIYLSFVGKVAESRGKTPEDMRQFAKGRVWTGEDAKDRGLVDVLGGLQTAINIAKVKIGVKESDKVRLSIFPRKEPVFERLLKEFKNEDDNEPNILMKLASAFGFGASELKTAISFVPKEIQNQIKYILNISQISMKEGAMVAMPAKIEIN